MSDTAGGGHRDPLGFAGYLAELSDTLPRDAEGQEADRHE